MLDDLIKVSRHFLKIKNSIYRRYFIQSDPFQHRLSLVLGQRGIGKTTTLIQYLLDRVSQDIYDPSILYVQADHFQVGNASLYEIAEQFHIIVKHKVNLASRGNFLINGEYLFEIGGNKKSFGQIKEEKNAFLASDNMEIGLKAKIPLWLFGFLY